MKYILILILLQIIKSNTLKKVNHTVIKHNNKNINLTKHHVRRAVRSMHSSFNNINSLHNKIRRNGHNMEHTAYNKLVKKYAEYVKAYNKNRKAVCAKLPDLWVLHKKKMPDNPGYISCKTWFYNGQLVGHKFAFAFHNLGYKANYSNYMKRHLSGINVILHRYQSNDKKIIKGRKCYYEGILHQVQKSMLGYKTNRPNLFKIKLEFHSLEQRRKELARILKNIKRRIK